MSVHCIVDYCGIVQDRRHENSTLILQLFCCCCCYFYLVRKTPDCVTKGLDDVSDVDVAFENVPEEPDAVGNGVHCL